jgi:uncharacterized membrane protein
MQFVASYVIALVVFGVIDALWLSTMGAILYRPVLGDILLQDLRIGPAIAFYLLFPIGIVIFAVSPALKEGAVTTALVYGLLFGAFAYGTYDLTNFATLRNWNLQITLIDIAYGAVTSGLCAAAAIAVLRYVPSTLGGSPG